MIQPGKWYRRGDGTAEEVGGPVPAHPGWVWTIQGNWYRASDGRYITCWKASADHEPLKIEQKPMDEPTWRDLGAEVTT